MKSLKAITAALIFSAGGAANAAIIEGNGTDAEVFISIVDSNANLSYHLDLGILTSSFESNPNLPSIDLNQDANFQTFLNNGGSLANARFNLAGYNSNLGNLSTFGSVYTTNQTPPLIDFAQTDQVQQAIQVYAQVLNAAEGAAYNGTNGGINLSAVSTNPAAPVPGFSTFGYHDDTKVWGSAMHASVNFNTEGVVDDPLEVYFAGFDITNGNPLTPLLLTTLTLSSNGVLSFGATAPVPVPAAVWLMGTGIVGLLAIGRRKSGQPEPLIA